MVFLQKTCTALFLHFLVYSGGGKDLIAKYKKKQLPTQAYALAQNHKHLPEITKYSLLKNYPHFSPLVGNFMQGMIVQLPLSKNTTGNYLDWKKIQACYQELLQK